VKEKKEKESVGK